MPAKLSDEPPGAHSDGAVSQHASPGPGVGAPVDDADWAEIMLSIIFRAGRGHEALPCERPLIESGAAFCRRQQISGTVVSALPDTVLRKDTIAELEGWMRPRGERQQALHRHFAAALAEIQSVFDEEGITWRLIKGPHVQTRYYGALAREFFDLDLLVPGGQFKRAQGALARTGWRAHVRGIVPLALVRRFEHALGMARGEALVDLHWSIRNMPGYRIDEARLFAGGRTSRWGGIDVPVLDPEYDLVVSLLSVAGGIVRQRTTLRDAADLFLVASAMETELPWSDFFEARQREGTERICLELLAAVVAWLDADQTLTCLREALQDRQVPLPPFGSNPLMRSVCGQDGKAAGRTWFLSAYKGSKSAYWLHTALSLIINQQFPYNLPRTFLFRSLLRR